MVKYSLGLILYFFLGLMTAMGQEEAAQVGFTTKIGQQMPDFKVEMLDGHWVDTKELRGKVILLDFWGAKCGGCLLAMKRFQADILELYGEREDFFLLPVEAQNHKKEDLLATAKRLNFKFPLAYENGHNIAGLFFNRAFGLPRTLIVDRDGKIVYQAFGYTEQEFSEMLKVLKQTIIKKN